MGVKRLYRGVHVAVLDDPDGDLSLCGGKVINLVGSHKLEFLRILAHTQKLSVAHAPRICRVVIHQKLDGCLYILCILYCHLDVGA